MPSYTETLFGAVAPLAKTQAQQLSQTVFDTSRDFVNDKIAGQTKPTTGPVSRQPGVEASPWSNIGAMFNKPSPIAGIPWGIVVGAAVVIYMMRK